MEFEWDEAKDAAKRAKHGVSLAEGALLNWAVGITQVDGRYSYGETRYRRLAALNGRVFACIFTLRGARIRVISLRKANAREIREHDERGI